MVNRFGYLPYRIRTSLNSLSIDPTWNVYSDLEMRGCALSKSHYSSASRSEKVYGSLKYDMPLPPLIIPWKPGVLRPREVWVTTEGEKPLI